MIEVVDKFFGILIPLMKSSLVESSLFKRYGRVWSSIRQSL